MPVSTRPDLPGPASRELSPLAFAALLLCLAPAAHAADPAAGATLYGSNCVSCHGSAAAPSLPAVLRARNAESVLRNAVNGGVAQMGFLKSLSAAQIADIAAYLGNSPGSLTFASTAQGSTSGIQTLTVQASDSLALSSFSASVSGDFVRQGGSCGSALAAGASCTIDVAFKPSAVGDRSGSLNMSHSGIAGGVSVALKGSATAAPSAPVLALSSSSLSFSEQVVSTASATQSLTLSNTGNAPLDFSSFTLTGAAAGDFLRGGSCAVGTPVAAGGSCALTVQFSPTSAGARNAALAVVSNGGSGNVALSGTAVLAPAPQAAFSASTLSFGTQTVGTTSAAQTLKLSNEGTAALSIASLQASAPFALSQDCGSSLAAKASCTLTLTFTPTGVGQAGGKITLVSNASGSPHEVQLSGTGALAAPNLAWSGSARSLDFGSSTVGAATAMQTLTLSNQGPGTATLSAIQLSGPAAADFLLDGSSTCTASTTLAVNASCKAVLAFLPKSAGARTAVLSVSSNGNTPGDISLSGTGVAAPAPVLSLSSRSLSFVRAAGSTTATTQTLSLQNSGNAPLTVKSLTLKGGSFALSAGATSACKNAPFTLAAGEQCNVQIGWNGSGNSDSGTLELSSDASPAVETVALSASVASTAGNAGGGGCTIGQGTQARDPSLLLMALGAALMLWRRARATRGNGAQA